MNVVSILLMKAVDRILHSSYRRICASIFPHASSDCDLIEIFVTWVIVSQRRDATLHKKNFTPSNSNNIVFTAS